MGAVSMQLKTQDVDLSLEVVAAAVAASNAVRYHNNSEAGTTP